MFVTSTDMFETSTVIIIIKKGQQCKAGREWYTPYQSEDPSPTIPTYRPVFLKVGRTAPLWALKRIKGAVAAWSKIGGR